MRNVRQNSRGFKESLPSLLDLDVDMEEGKSEFLPIGIIFSDITSNMYIFSTHTICCESFLSFKKRF